MRAGEWGGCFPLYWCRRTRKYGRNERARRGILSSSGPVSHSPATPLSLSFFTPLPSPFSTQLPSADVCTAARTSALAASRPCSAPSSAGASARRGTARQLVRKKGGRGRGRSTAHMHYKNADQRKLELHAQPCCLCMEGAVCSPAQAGTDGRLVPKQHVRPCLCAGGEAAVTATKKHKACTCAQGHKCKQGITLALLHVHTVTCTGWGHHHWYILGVLHLGTHTVSSCYTDPALRGCMYVTRTTITSEFGSISNKKLSFMANWPTHSWLLCHARTEVGMCFACAI